MLQRIDRPLYRRATRPSPLARYLEGWAEANPAKIFEATTHGYFFRDPLVGIFPRWSLFRYFAMLHARLRCGGSLTAADLGFCLHGPMDAPHHDGMLQFYREAPRLGLTGIARIEIGERGVIGECASYDLNLASDMLRPR